MILIYMAQNLQMGTRYNNTYRQSDDFVKQHGWSHMEVKNKILEQENEGF